MEANGIQLKKLNTKTEKIEKIYPNDLESTISKYFKERSFIVLYLDNEVLIGTWENNAFHFCNSSEVDFKHIQKMRVFNSNQELFIWRTSNGHRGRLRIDDLSGNETEVVVGKQALFGTDSEPVGNDNYTRIFEERGAQLLLPIKGLKVDTNKNPKHRIFIRTYNYIDYNEVPNQASYVDCRFVNFCDENQDLI